MFYHSDGNKLFYATLGTPMSAVPPSPAITTTSLGWSPNRIRNPRDNPLATPFWSP